MFVGIDLGTTNSAIAVVDGTGRPDVIANAEGARVTPSAVFFEPGSTKRVVVGQAAKDNKLVYRDRGFEGFKRHMATNEAIVIDDVSVTPIDLSGFVLRKLVQDASHQVGPIKRAVVTVPANFTNEARLATIQAGGIAGFDVSHIVNEPTAALFYYSFQHAISGTVVVYDFGGGTLDVTVARVVGKNVEIVASKGDPRLGGIDFDSKLMDVIARAFRETTGETFNSEIHHLGKTPEDYKKQLSSRDEAAVQVTGGNSGRRILTITRRAFESATSTLISKADLLVESTLDEAGLKPEDVKEIFLVGGSTRMPMVKRHLAELFRKEPVCHANPDEVVALGAALYAAFNADSKELNPAQASVIRTMSLQDVANHYFGTISLSEDHRTGRRELRNSILIDKNTPLPCSKTEAYYTVSEGQTQVHCRVTQSATSESDPDFVRVIWEGELGPLPPGRAKGMEVRVTYSYDTNQLMHCVFEDVATGKRQEVDIGLKSEKDSQGSSGLDRFLVE